MPAGTQEYFRYQQTADGISPIANVGDPDLMYRTSGLTHDIKGSPAFDAETHQALHEKRYEKLLPLAFRDELVQIMGHESASSGIITWGSSAQIVRDTLVFLGLENRIKICVPELICPLPRKVDTFIKSVEHLLVIEMNYSGQLYRYLRSQIDLPADTHIYCRAGGRPFSRSELRQPIEELCYD